MNIKILSALSALCMGAAFVGGCEESATAKNDMTSLDEVVVGCRFGLKAQDELMPDRKGVLREEARLGSDFLGGRRVFLEYAPTTRLLRTLELHRTSFVYKGKAGEEEDAKIVAEARRVFKAMVREVEMATGVACGEVRDSEPVRDSESNGDYWWLCHSETVAFVVYGENDKYIVSGNMDGCFMANFEVMSRRIGRIENEARAAAIRQL